MYKKPVEILAKEIRYEPSCTRRPCRYSPKLAQLRIAVGRPHRGDGGKSDTTILKYYLWYVWPFWTIQYNLLLLGYGSDNNKMWIRYIMVTGFNALSLAFA
jgi:hypothetical protein